MKLREIVIDTNQPLFEAAYPGNIGLMEMMRFHQVATPEQKQRMEQIIDAGDWEAFKALIFEVLNIRLV